MTNEKAYYRVDCLDGTCMGFTSSKPEILDALEAVVEQLVSLQPQNLFLDVAYEAIAKATGQ